MKILIAVVAEHAWVEGGCLSLCRAFDTITAEKFPYRIPRLSIAMRLLIGRSEVGKHKLNVTLVDVDGKKLMDSTIDIKVGTPPNNIPEVTFSAVINGQNVSFPHPGDFVFNILIDGRMASSIPLYVRVKK